MKNEPRNLREAWARSEIFAWPENTSLPFIFRNTFPSCGHISKRKSRKSAIPCSDSRPGIAKETDMHMGIRSGTIGNLAKRVATQAAISATVMTGLHFAAGSGLSPADWLYGPGDADVSVPSGRVERDVTSLPSRPEFRFAGIPAADAEPPAGETDTPQAARRQAVAAPSDRPHNSLATAKAGPHGVSDCPTDCLPVVSARLAIPTPRPHYVRQDSVRTEQAGIEPLQIAALAMTAARPEPTTDGAPELGRDEAIPHPPEVSDLAQRRSIIADILPAAPMVVEEAGLLARAAGGTVGEIAGRTFGRLLQ